MIISSKHAYASAFLLNANFMQAESMWWSLMMYTEVCAASCKSTGHERQISQVQQADRLVW